MKLFNKKYKNTLKDKSPTCPLIPSYIFIEFKNNKLKNRLNKNPTSDISIE